MFAALVIVTVQLPLAAPAPATASRHVAGEPPPSLAEKLTVTELYPPDEPSSVNVGWLMVRALAVAAGPGPAALTAVTLTVTRAPSPKPPSVALVPVTSWLGPVLGFTTYRRMGRPLSCGARQLTWIAPRWLGTWAATRFTGRSGTVKGTTVLLTGDGLELAPRSLIDATVKAYCLP